MQFFIGLPGLRRVSAAGGAIAVYYSKPRREVYIRGARK